MRVLMVAIKFPPFFAGAVVQAVRLAKELQKNGVEVQFITDNGQHRSVSEVYEGLPVFRFSTYFKRESKLREFIYVAQIIIYLLRNHKRFDVVHFHSMKGLECLIFPICKALGKKVVLKVTLIDNDDPVAFSRRKMGALISWGHRYVDRFAVISSGLYERCLASKIPAEKIQIIYNGVNNELFVQPRLEEKRQLRMAKGYSDYNKIFLSIGKVEHRKGYDLLIESWSAISEAFPKSLLLIAGPGAEDSNPYYVEIKNKISRLSLWNILFVGQIDSPAEYVRLADCFLFCSRAEGFGTVLIEAMACGVPVIAMNIPGVTQDIIKSDKIGHICFSLQPADFAAETVTFLKGLDQKALTLAAADVSRDFGICKIAATYIDLYKKLCVLPVNAGDAAKQELSHK